MLPVDPPGAPRCIRFDAFTFDAERRVLFHRGERVHLTAKPLETLTVLLSRPGEAISKQDLLRTVWRDTAVTEDVLVQAIGEIRRALGERKGENRFVQTIPRHGYRFVMPVTSGDEVFAARAPGSRWRGLIVRRPRRAAFVALLAVAALTAAGWIVRANPRLTAGWLRFRAGPTVSPDRAAAALTEVSARATVHAAGIVVRIAGDQNRDAEVSLDWQASGESFRSGHPLVRVDDSHFAGSLFWLTGDTSYELKVTLRDPDGVNGASSQITTLRTEADAWPEAALGVLHVSPTGVDSNTGASADAALRTIQRAADLANPGDVVLIHPGVYREAVYVRKSGTWIQPIVFRGVGSGAILDGSDASIDARTNWRSRGYGIHSLGMEFSTSHVSTERGRLFKYASLDDLRALRAGAPGGFFADRGTLYIKFADGSSPADHAIHVGRLDRGFIVENQSWVGIEGLELRYFGGANDGVGILLRDCTSCRVRRTRIHEVRRAGIWVEGGERTRIEDNEIWDTSILSWPWHAISSSTAENHGIVVTGTNPLGLIIRRNRIHGTFDAIAPCGSRPPSTALTTETDVYDNDLWELADDGIEAEPYCANLRIWNNRITGTMMAISTAPAGPGPIWILRNVAHRFGATRGREVWLASALKVNTFEKTETGPVFLYHNTFVADVPTVDGIALLDPARVVFVRARNNVIAGTRHALMKINPLHWDGDANNLYSTSGLALVHWHGMPYSDIAAFRNATGQERIGFSGPPQFINAGRGDFTPGAGSPLVDRGVHIAGVNDRFAGRAPDVGAIERQNER